MEDNSVWWYSSIDGATIVYSTTDTSSPGMTYAELAEVLRNQMLRERLAAQSPGNAFAQRDSDSKGRAPLDWNKPVKVDRFPGYKVKKWPSLDALQLIDGPITPDCKPATAGLTHSPDTAPSGHQVDFRHGSAFLKG